MKKMQPSHCFERDHSTDIAVVHKQTHPATKHGVITNSAYLPFYLVTVHDNKDKMFAVVQICKTIAIL